MQKNSLEDYIGAIYRLRKDNGEPLPLNRLQEYFGFSPISIHEMVTKLDQQELIEYLPYKGVRLSEKGETVAASLIRRHRIWERFLTDSLGVSWGESHELAHELEHAAPDWVTERLAGLLGNPESCPHGDLIPSEESIAPEMKPFQVNSTGRFQIVKISPEIPAYLERLQRDGLMPGDEIEVKGINETGVLINKNGENQFLPNDLIKTVWVNPLKNEEL